MSDQETERTSNQASNQAIDRAIEQALQQQTNVAVPEGFAARVRAQLPAVRPAPRRFWQRMSAGQMAGLVGLVALVAAFCWLAPGARPDFMSLRFDLELVVLGEMAGVGWWVGKGIGARP